jgi:hypothetical protein
MKAVNTTRISIPGVKQNTPGGHIFLVLKTILLGLYIKGA